MFLFFSQKEQNIEEGYYGPLLVEKILFSEVQAKELELMNQEVSAENGEILVAEKTALDKFVQKGEVFVGRLEKELEDCKSKGARTVELTEEMVYPGSDSDGFSNGSDTQDHKDPIEKLKNWYPTIEESVKTQQAKLYPCAHKWFEKLNKSVSRNVESKSSKTDQDRNQTANILIYVAIVLVCALNAFFFYSPEDVQRCTEEPMECVAKDIKDFFQWAMDGYLEFHNISLKNQGVKMQNAVQVLEV